jgi:hypothetical protein
MNAWSLPQSALIGDVEYPINSDFRDILEIIRYLNDETKTVYLRWKIALALFFDGEIPDKYEEEAAQYLSDFISCGKKEEKSGPKLIDWEQDALLIVTDINKVAGKEIRAEKYLHWWTFMSYFNGIGEGQLSTVVGIRSKKAKGKKLDKGEQEYYREHKSDVDFSKGNESQKAEIQEYFSKWL